MLRDLFGLVTHSEARPADALVLTIRPDERVESDLRRSSLVCTDDGGQQLDEACGLRTGGTLTNASIDAGGVGIDDLAKVLSMQSSIGPVVDNTGLTGVYDLSLRYDIRSLRPPQATSDTVVDAAPSIFTAVREQLGLELSRVTAPVDFFVIDHVERPTPN